MLTNNTTGDVGISAQDVTGNFLAATGLAGGTLQSGQNLLYTLADGTQLEIAACLFVTVNGDGRITRIEEYADTRAADPLLALAAAQRAQRGLSRPGHPSAGASP